MDVLDIIRFWFDKSNSDLWFNATATQDHEITDKFKGYLSLELENEELTSDLTKLKPSEYLAHLILYDQLVRHFFRNNDVAIANYHKKALLLATNMLDRGFDDGFNPEERCFLLLPLRHTFELEYLEIVIEKIKQYMTEYNKDEIPAIYKRFWRATLVSHSVVKTGLIDIEPIDNDITDDAIFEILDKGDKLDTVNTTAVANLIEVTDLYYKDSFYKAFDECLTAFGHDNYTGVVVSLSGGVDSMVCSFVLHHYLKRRGKELIAVHINYGNRDTCELEVELVKRWCKLLGIKLYIRHIKHLKRSRDRDRDMYEEVTRIMRFHMYKRFGYPVVLGHNRDDMVENMLTNIRKSKCFDNLRGMRNIGQEDDVVILRPMLEIMKSDIYEFARVHKIPHLEDSTPLWSDRGRMRDELIPFLNRFDPAFIPGLFKLANSMVDMYKIYNGTVLTSFKERMIKEIDGVLTITITSDSPELSYGYQFWKDVIYDVTNSRDIEAPSHKSILSMCERFESRRYGKISMTKSLIMNFNKNGIQLLF